MRRTRATTTRRRAARPSAAPERRPDALEEVIDETRALFHRLRAVAEQVHAQGELSGGRRGVMKDLARLGPQTVPQLARRRPVSRQHIQSLVNPLLEEGYLERIDNPAHRRSPLLRLTPRGESLVATMDRRESRLLPDLELAISERDLRRAAETLRAVRQAFASDAWSQRLERFRREEEAAGRRQGGQRR
jgi:DNA-binding MarR family transcriptional regulator